MKLYKAPSPVENDDKNPSIFLAGSIEMGNAEPWQEKVEKFFSKDNITIINPRRDDWDSSWIQDISNPQFYEQVRWELHYIQSADAVIFYFDPKTKSPITLLELGIVSSGYKDSTQIAAVCCPDGYWRKGNIQVVCDTFGLRLYKNLEDMLTFVKTMLL